MGCVVARLLGVFLRFGVYWCFGFVRYEYCIVVVPFMLLFLRGCVLRGGLF